MEYISTSTLGNVLDIKSGDLFDWGGKGIYFVNIINPQGVTIETRKIVLQ